MLKNPQFISGFSGLINLFVSFFIILLYLAFSSPVVSGDSISTKSGLVLRRSYHFLIERESFDGELLFYLLIFLSVSSFGFGYFVQLNYLEFNWIIYLISTVSIHFLLFLFLNKLITSSENPIVLISPFNEVNEIFSYSQGYKISLLRSSDNTTLVIDVPKFDSSNLEILKLRGGNRGLLTRFFRAMSTENLAIQLKEYTIKQDKNGKFFKNQDKRLSLIQGSHKELEIYQKFLLEWLK